MPGRAPIEAVTAPIRSAFRNLLVIALLGGRIDSRTAGRTLTFPGPASPGKTTERARNLIYFSGPGVAKYGSPLFRVTTGGE
jgi:hypothetical protein